MAFGGTGGFSFGNNNNNNQQSTGFGGFGNNNTNTGFGASTNTGFGASTTGTNPFGGGTSTFGNTGGFGANNSTGTTSLFGGNKPAASSPFGASTGTTSIFGNTANNTTTGGFGAGGFGNTANTGGFGNTTNTTGGGFTFGNTANKPAFGASSTTPLFGQGGAGTTGGFGGTSAFGSSGTGTALNQPVGPSDGTASTPFAATSEKEPNGVTNSYQSITFQQPYQKYSFEELRLADYNAGRQFGNGSGQPQAFGSNAFGGFGSTATGGFGNTNTNTNPFGGAATTSTGFGANTATSGFGGGNSLFGNTANKPGGLFGSTAATTAGTTGSLFGTANNTTTTTGFGGTNTGFGNTNTGTSGSLFGNNNQAKPAGSLFGNTGTTNNAFSFGNNAQQAGTTGSTLFGNNNTSTNTGSNLFGNNTQQNSTGGMFGNNTQQGNSLFGNKTGTGFGTAATQSQTGSLFGTANNTANTGGSLFGANNNTTNNNTGGGLFGGNANTGSSLFGNNNATNQTGQKSLFGNSFGTPNAGTNTGGSLFGNNNTTNNQASGSLFGNNNNNTSGGFGFGNTNANKPTTSLFGNAGATQQSGGLFGSSMNNNNNGLFGQSQNNQQNNQQQQDMVKHASLLDPNPYGQSSIWTGLPQPTPENAKPVFTPLTATQKMKESMMKPPPSLRLNQSRYMTPPRRNGFGLSYSTYGTPNSAASTPGGAGLSGSMYGSRGFSGGSFGRSFNKSASVQNLRSQFTSDSDDIWKPGAFASTHRNSGGSIKRLTIDRTIRNDLFSRPSLPALPAPEQSTTNSANVAPSAPAQTNGESHQDTSNKLKKRVSFENGTSGGQQNSQLNSESGALVRTESDEHDRREGPSGRSNGAAQDTQSRGKDLAAVPEDRESHHVSSPPPTAAQKADPKAGDYWMKPTRAELAKMPREKLQKFKNFQVGRYGCGQVTFNGVVDLTALPVDELYEKIVEIRLREITVYPDASSKPPVGKGLNVPSTLEIENSWPRSRNRPTSDTSGPVFEKHINLLKKQAQTEFIDYDTKKGIWKFRVAHYTRYGLDYDDDDEDEDMSELTPPPDTIEQSSMDVESDEYEDEHDDEDDTFAFRQKIVPGGFGKGSVVDYEPKSNAPADAMEHDSQSEQSAYSDEELSEDEPSMAGSFPTTSVQGASGNKPILKASHFGTPGKPLLDLEGDWAEQLQRTISPRKQNRDLLRETQNKVLLDRVYSPIKPKQVEKQDFRTSIDVMNSLFGLNNNKGNRGRTQAKAMEPEFEFPYAKRAKIFDSNLDDMSDADKKWHDSFKTQFTGVGDLIYRKNTKSMVEQQPGYAYEELVSNRQITVIKSSLKNDTQQYELNAIIPLTDVTVTDGVPFAQRQQVSFSYLSEHLVHPATFSVESNTYNLLHILFDNYEDEFSQNLPPAARERYEPQIRKERLTQFLYSYVMRRHGEKLAQVEKENLTAAAVLRLTAKDIKGACDALEKAKNYRLMILVSQLENVDETFQDDIRVQIDAWREQCTLSEITEDVRGVYEVCAGNTTIAAGKAGNNVPVEDKAKTFSLADEYGLDWIQCFALGLWYGREEKRYPSPTGSVSIETAVLEFEKRCQRKEESQLPGNDPLWVVLKLYAAAQGVLTANEKPILPNALDAMNETWDASTTLSLHHSIITNIEGVSIDEDAEEELTGLLAYQLSSKGDIAGAAHALLHLQDPQKREIMVKSLLERFAGQLPDPPAIPSSAATVHQLPPSTSELWTVLTTHLKIPSSWLYHAKALHARAALNDSTKELQYLVAAQAWPQAHECFTHRVAPALIVDYDIPALTETVSLFDDDVMEKVAGWEMGGGVYADFALMCTAKGQNLNQDAIEGLRKRLVELGRRFKKGVDLGKVPVEELEQRVAVQEMSRIVAEKFSGDRKYLLELPLTSDQRLVQTMAMAAGH